MNLVINDGVLTEEGKALVRKFLETGPQKIEGKPTPIIGDAIAGGVLLSLEGLYPDVYALSAHVLDLDLGDG